MQHHCCLKWVMRYKKPSAQPQNSSVGTSLLWTPSDMQTIKSIKAYNWTYLQYTDNILYACVCVCIAFIYLSCASFQTYSKDSKHKQKIHAQTDTREQAQVPKKTWTVFFFCSFKWPIPLKDGQASIRSIKGSKHFLQKFSFNSAEWWALVKIYY